MSALHPKADIEAPGSDVGFAPESGHPAKATDGAKLKLMGRSKKRLINDFVGDQQKVARDCKT
jgi:hypothetical protein